MANRFARRRPRLERRPRVLIVCEGEKTEPGYFRELRREEEIRLLTIEVVGKLGVPLKVVETAVRMSKEARLEARRSGDDGLAYDEVWCVFDVDQHPNLQEALNEARTHDVNVALSNPCFELWILLHFQDQRAHIGSDRLADACRTHIPNYQKEAPYNDLRPRYEAAVERARKLDAWQQQQGRQDENPTTRVYRLTERLRALGRPAFLKELAKTRR